MRHGKIVSGASLSQSEKLLQVGYEVRCGAVAKWQEDLKDYRLIEFEAVGSLAEVLRSEVAVN